jgi:hypothetical protein
VLADVPDVRVGRGRRQPDILKAIDCKAEDLPEVGPRFRLHAHHKVSDLALDVGVSYESLHRWSPGFVAAGVVLDGPSAQGGFLPALGNEAAATESALIGPPLSAVASRADLLSNKHVRQLS